MRDGIWVAIAAGVVFRSMTHVSGRRPPHAAERSAALIRDYHDRRQYAEAVGGLVERIADAGPVAPDRVRRYLSTRPEADLDLDLDHLQAAAAEVRAVAARWSTLRIGADLSVDWPAWQRLPAPRIPGRRAG